jgi:bifunctional DNA-binding transcriptional regulator/antitoxin component of YhaV-PrlF toxin-antitoxin module
MKYPIKISKRGTFTIPKNIRIDLDLADSVLLSKVGDTYIFSKPLASEQKKNIKNPVSPSKQQLQNSH